MKCNVLSILVGVIILSACETHQPSRPNIIFIYTDDQAHWTLGVSGNSQSVTPNMDRLAREGAWLRNAFTTTPVCSPARASLMTSQYASEYGILDFIPQPGHRLYDPAMPVGLDPASKTFAEVLKDAGYVNGLIGKWHLGDWTEAEDDRYHPTNHGFDYFMGITGGGTSPKDPTLEKDGVIGKVEGFTTDILTDHALSFIEKNKEAPFLLCVNYRAPHGPWLPVTEEDWAPFENMDPALPHPDFPDLDAEKAKRKMREYLASTHSVDRNIGRIFRQLRETGLEDNTVIIFSSDHGYNMGHNGIEHKGNGYWITRSDHPATKNIAKNSRPNMYDNSLRVPALVKWPAVIKPGTIIDQTVSNLDWYPTIVEIAGLPLPKDKVIRGRSILPLLRGDEVNNWNNDLYTEYSMIHYSRAYMRSYRTPEWKLVKDFLDPSRDEIYHLAVDPEEKRNLIKADAKQVQVMIDKLSDKIYEHMRITKDTLLRSQMITNSDVLGK